MTITRRITVFDAADIGVESAFWAALLGGAVDDEPEDDWHSIRVDGTYQYAVQLAPDHQRPDWPDGTPQQVHLDLHVDDLATEHERAVGLGAAVLQSAVHDDDGGGFQVYASPAGHPFCLCWG